MCQTANFHLRRSKVRVRVAQLWGWLHTGFPRLLESFGFFSWKFQDKDTPGKSLWSWKVLEIKARGRSAYFSSCCRHDCSLERIMTEQTRARSVWSIWLSKPSSFRRRWTSWVRARRSTWCHRYRYARGGPTFSRRATAMLCLSSVACVLWVNGTS